MVVFSIFISAFLIGFVCGGYFIEGVYDKRENSVDTPPDKTLTDHKQWVEDYRADMKMLAEIREYINQRNKQ